MTVSSLGVIDPKKRGRVRRRISVGAGLPGENAPFGSSHLDLSQGGEDGSGDVKSILNASDGW